MKILGDFELCRSARNGSSLSPFCRELSSFFGDIFTRLVTSEYEYRVPEIGDATRGEGLWEFKLHLRRNHLPFFHFRCNTTTGPVNSWPP